MRKLTAFIMLCLVLLPVSILVLLNIPAPVQAEAEGVRKVWSFVPQLTWVGKTPATPDGLSITVNGAPVEPKELIINNYEDTVHVRIPLKHVTGSLVMVREGNNTLFSADVFYAATYEARLVPEEYEVRPFHTAQNEQTCRACHRLSPGMSDIVPSSPAESMCYPCHKQEFSGLEFQHREAGVSWECLRCHQAEPIENEFSMSGPVRFAIKEGNRVAPMCYRCHINKAKEHAGFKYLHGPVAMAGCNMCHNPHGSNTRRLLQKDISKLCIECHRFQDRLKQPVVHEPLLREGCITCHDPHGSNSPFFLAAAIDEACFKCHPYMREKGDNHPVLGHPVSGPDDPLVKERPFSCISCHDPHAAEYDKLLPKEEIMMLCSLCHQREM